MGGRRRGGRERTYSCPLSLTLPIPLLRSLLVSCSLYLFSKPPLAFPSLIAMCLSPSAFALFSICILREKMLFFYLPVALSPYLQPFPLSPLTLINCQCSMMYSYTLLSNCCVLHCLEFDVWINFP